MKTIDRKSLNGDPVILPTIHMNGTSRDSLSEDLCGAYNALREAYDALKRSAPHGRDYYPQGDGALSVAQGQHRARLLAVQSVMDELAAVGEEIASG
jgi:hypothetical protein